MAGRGRTKDRGDIVDHAKMKQITKLINEHGGKLEGAELNAFINRAVAAFDNAQSAPPPPAPPAEIVQQPEPIITAKAVEPLTQHFYSRLKYFISNPAAFDEKAKEEITRIIFLMDIVKQLTRKETAK